MCGVDPIYQHCVFSNAEVRLFTAIPLINNGPAYFRQALISLSKSVLLKIQFTGFPNEQKCHHQEIMYTSVIPLHAEE